jgi:glycosyltransferase involved in cell wall biosynthesis
MRIAHLTATFPPYWGGTGTVAFNQAKGLAERGHDVHVFTGTQGSPSDDPPGVTVHRIEPAFAIGNAPLLPELARLRGFDVVHFHHPFIFGTEMALLGRMRRRRAALVATYHNRLIGEGGRAPIFWAYEETAVRAVMRAADRVCVVSMDHAMSVSHLRAARRRHPERIVEVPNGVDTELFQPGPRSSAEGIPPEATVAVFAAALDRAHHFKRLDLVIDALPKTPADLHLLVVGGGDMLDDYKARAARTGVGDRVHFAGAQPHEQLPALMHAGDFFVLATEPPESFGLVITEAMASGLPAIASDIPGVRTVVDDRKTGLLVPAGDVGALASAMADLAGMTTDEREALGAAARAKCESVYAWPRIIDRLEVVYADALAGRTTTGSSSSAA